jgi:kynurenine formamidase
MPLVDLSAPIEPSPDDALEALRVDIDYSDHAAGAKQIEQLFGLPARLLRNGEGWANDEFRRFGTHSSTHVDAPWHYNSTIRGEPAMRIDELPLEWFFSDGVVLDMTGREDGEVVDRADVELELERIGHELKPLDIVLISTGRDEFYGQLDYMARGTGVTAEATRWLYDCGVRVMGIDAWGWDRPLHIQAAEALESDEPGVFWEAHQCELQYSQIERLVNLAALPPTGFRVACFPLRIVAASAAPARVVAIVPEGDA